MYSAEPDTAAVKTAQLRNLTTHAAIGWQPVRSGLHKPRNHTTTLWVPLYDNDLTPVVSRRRNLGIFVPRCCYIAKVNDDNGDVGKLGRKVQRVGLLVFFFYNGHTNIFDVVAP